MNRHAFILIAALLVGACSSRESTLGEAASQPTTAEVTFYVPPLVEASRPPLAGVSEWSPNDDRDTIYVVLRGIPMGSTVGISFDAVVRRVSLADEAGNAEPKDTVGRQINWQPRIDVRPDSLQKMGDGQVVKIVQPSRLDRMLPGVDAKSDEKVVALRVTVFLPSGAELTRTLRLLPSA